MRNETGREYSAPPLFWLRVIERKVIVKDNVTTGSMMEASNSTSDWCFQYDDCTFKYSPCDRSEIHPDLRYNDASASWVLISAIIVFFMKAGLMLIELAFAKEVKDRRKVIIIKHQDAFASAFGFFLLGFDLISRYSPPQNIPILFFGITDPLLWFFKFTFASNAATIVGGCLVTNKYKLRLPAAFISAFVISGIIHPIVARIIWSDDCRTLSPYRFCVYEGMDKHSCNYDCTNTTLSLSQRLYVLDFAGGGAVHLLGGIAGLMICLFAKLQEWRDKDVEQSLPGSGENPECYQPEGFWDSMYPIHGGNESISDAALGVMILWFCWFAFNCGSTESIELGRPVITSTGGDSSYPYYGIPAVIAINMIMAVAAGGTTAVVIASYIQVLYEAESVNANEIANGILSSLVAITAGCAFVDYWGACLIGVIAVILYHCGCYLEYKFGVKDTARVVPVHGVCGLWSLIAVAVFQTGDTANCNLHAAFEGLCFCQLRLPSLSYGEHFLAQISGALIMIGIGVVGTGLMYGILYVIPIQPFFTLFRWMHNLLFHKGLQWLSCGRFQGKELYQLSYRGGCLLTNPQENQRQRGYIPFRDRHHEAFHRGPTTTYGTSNFISLEPGVGSSINDDPSSLPVPPPAANHKAPPPAKAAPSAATHKAPPPAKSPPLAADEGTSTNTDTEPTHHNKSKVV